MTFDPNSGTYVALAASDSQPFGGYEVSFDPMTDEFRCECPAFTYSRNRHCKHVSRVGGIITDYVDSLHPTFEVEAPAPEWTSPDNTEEPRFEVSFNDGAYKVLEADTVSWLLDTVRAGDTVHLRRLP